MGWHSKQTSSSTKCNRASQSLLRCQNSKLFEIIVVMNHLHSKHTNKHNTLWNGTVHIIFNKWRVSIQSKLCSMYTTAKYAVPIWNILFVFIHSILCSIHTHTCMDACACLQTHTHPTVLYPYKANYIDYKQMQYKFWLSLRLILLRLRKCSTAILTSLYLMSPLCHFYLGLRTRMALSAI